MINTALKELIGLFVDDEFLAGTILCAVAVATLLALSQVAPGWLVGLMLIVALPTALAGSVVRSVRRKRQPSRA